jgi:hypothetical protein
MTFNLGYGHQKLDGQVNVTAEYAPGQAVDLERSASTATS